MKENEDFFNKRQTMTLKNNYSKQLGITTIPPHFYRNIIELENKIQLSKMPSTEDIRELGTLYKKAIEVFCSKSPRKMRFYSNKLTRLLIGVDKLEKKQKKKDTKWSQYMNAHKKSYNQFMLFLQLESSNQEANQIIDEANKNFGNAYDELYNNIDEQKKNFRERMKMKKMKKNNKNEIINDDDNYLQKISGENNYFYISKLKKRDDLVDLSLKDFLKKFHYIYLRAKIFEEPIESFNYILDDIFCHKVAKYYYYQDQIKEFELMLGDKDRGNHDDSLAFFLTDLHNERKTYYMTLETFIDNIKQKIRNRCSDTHISKDQQMEKYLQEFMNNISKIFV